jgi:hypothetical protein
VRPKAAKAVGPTPTRIVQPERRVSIPLVRGAATVASAPVPATAEALDRRRLAVAGAALALVAAGGTVLLLAARRQLREPAR